MKKVSKRSGKLGLPPGSLVHVGTDSGGKASLQLFEYDAVRVSEREFSSLGELNAAPDEGTIHWLNVDGLRDDTLMQETAQRFELHSLLVEDILNTDHRPKVEEYQDSLFVVAKMLRTDPMNGRLLVEQISFILRKGMLISFQERRGDVLDPVRERLRQSLGRVRKSGADYLLYALLDVIVDHYFVVLDEFGNRIEDLEAKVIARPRNEDLRSIQHLRGQLIAVTKHVTPMRELSGRLNTLESPLIDKSTRRYLNDLQDHTVYIAETIGTYRELLTSLENTYHAGVNLRMGQVMKLLTVISTIFIPLTFIVGIYGMNFRHMPELEWRYGYFGVMGSMGIIALLMLIWFRRKKWL
jgi:magnesium transporter